MIIRTPQFKEKGYIKLPNWELKAPKSAKITKLSLVIRDAVQEIWNNYNLWELEKITEREQVVKKYLEITNIVNAVKNSPTLRDVFKVDNDGFIVVKNPWEKYWESKLLSWHFPLEWLTVTQGVVLRQLFEEVSWVKPNEEFNTRVVDFPEKWIIPGSRLKIVEDWIVLENWERVLKYELREWIWNIENFTSGVFDSFYHLNNPENFVLHAWSARVFENVFVALKKEWELSIWDIFEWSYHVLNLPELLDKDWNFNQTFLDEIAAQVASAWFSHIENKDLFNRYWAEAKEKDSFRLLTYKNTENTIFNSQIKIWDENPS